MTGDGLLRDLMAEHRQMCTELSAEIEADADARKIASTKATRRSRDIAAKAARAHICPRCSADMVRRVYRMLRVYSCAGCTFTRQVVRGEA